MAVNEQQVVEIKSAGIAVHSIEEAKAYEAQAFLTPIELKEAEKKFKEIQSKTPSH